MHSNIFPCRYTHLSLLYLQTITGILWVNCIWFTACAFCLCDKLGIIYAAESIQSYGKGGFSHTLAHLHAASGRI